MSRFLTFLFLLSSVFLSAQSFTNIGPDQNIENYVDEMIFGTGISFCDVDNDGWDDITVASNHGECYLYLNNQGNFELFPFLDSLDSGASKSPIWVDFDNDGDKDFFTTRQYDSPILLRNDGNMEFTDITESAGFYMDSLHNSSGNAWGDYDNDGFLDVFICEYQWVELFEFPQQNSLYHNNGDGTFTNVIAENGMSGYEMTFMPIWVDFDQNGTLDLYLINDKTDANVMYSNNGDGTFTDVSTELGLDIVINDMSNSWGDFDNDQDLDVYLSNGPSGNVFLENQDSIFMDITADTDLAIEHICWGANWVDVDNDRNQDLYVCTMASMGIPGLTLSNYFFLNNGNSTFTNYTDSSVFSNDVKTIYSCASGDINNDGRIDLFTGGQFQDFTDVWLNTTDNDNNYIKVSLQGVISNRDGIGAWIKVYSDGVTQVRFTHCGEDYLTQDSQHEIIGMGTSSTVDSLIIQWPSGVVDSFYQLPVNNSISIVEGESYAQIQYDNMPVCAGEYVEMIASSDLDNILWNTGDTTNTIVVEESGSVYFTAEIGNGLIIHSDTVNVEVGQPIEAIVESGMNINCVDSCVGYVNFTDVSGGFAPYSYPGSLTNLCPGNHTFTITDSLGCTADFDVVIDSILQPNFDLSVNDVSCFNSCDGSIDLQIDGGYPPFSFLNEPNLCAGPQSLLVSDVYGCEFVLDFVVNQPDSLNLEVALSDDGTLAWPIVSGGTPDYEFLWSTGETQDTLVITEGGTYSLVVVDSAGCTSNVVFNTNVSVAEANLKTVSVYPNPVTNVLNVLLDGKYDYSIYSSDGRLIRRELNQDFPQKIDFRKIAEGSYFVEFQNKNQKFIVPVIKSN